MTKDALVMMLCDVSPCAGQYKSRQKGLKYQCHQLPGCYRRSSCVPTEILAVHVLLKPLCFQALQTPCHS